MSVRCSAFRFEMFVQCFQLALVGSPLPGASHQLGIYWG